MFACSPDMPLLSPKTRTGSTRPARDFERRHRSRERELLFKHQGGARAAQRQPSHGEENRHKARFA